jgi:hypothetical protein
MLFRCTLSTNRPQTGPIVLPKAESTSAAFLHGGKSVATITGEGAIVICDLSGEQSPDVLRALGTNNVWSPPSFAELDAEPL